MGFEPRKMNLGSGAVCHLLFEVQAGSLVHLILSEGWHLFVSYHYFSIPDLANLHVPVALAVSP